MVEQCAVNALVVGSNPTLGAIHNFYSLIFIGMPKKVNSAFMKPMKLSADLEAVVGKGPMPRSEVVKNLWMYIKGDAYESESGKKGSSLRKGPSLQDAKNKRNINADANLMKVFGGKKVVNMFEMTKLVSQHLS